MRALFCAAILIGSVAATSRAEAKIVADCGAASGKVFYAKADENVWRDDAITGGRVLIDSLPDGEVNVIFRDAMARTINVKDDGGFPVIVWRNEDWSKFTVTVVYPETGAVETYVLANTGGEKSLLWSTSRQAMGPIPPKVSAYVSKCE
jgi:hypothetical protein